MNDADTPRAQWQTSYGFVLAALGGAIGIGNIWRFSYVAGENGGGAFLVIYGATLLIIGVPMLLAELAVGQTAQREAASAFSQLGRSCAWRQVGLLGVIVAFVILTYYAVICGWALKYFAVFAAGAWPGEPGGALSYFRTFTGAPVEPTFWHASAMAATVGIVIGGVERGIERANKLLMPALGVIVIALALHSLFLSDAHRGLLFLFSPNWEQLASPRIYLAALGQAFFSLGLAMGFFVTYGSYVPRDRRLPATGITIVVGDTLFAVAAAVVIFPAVFSFGMDPTQGPGLAFVTLPEIFSRMTGGTVVGTAFFGLLALAAITSSVALLEVSVAFAIERLGLSRMRSTVTIAAIAFGLGVPSSLGFGPWSSFKIAGLPILEAIDFFASNVMLPLSGLATALFVGWHWREARTDIVGFRHGWAFQAWRFAIRYIAPVAIAIILLRSLSIL
jgi:NSS family neurotransmitter:Na+ symporter